MPMAAAIGRRRTPDLLREYMRQRRLAGEIATLGDLRQTQVRTRQVLLYQAQAEDVQEILHRHPRQDLHRSGQFHRIDPQDAGDLVDLENTPEKEDLHDGIHNHRA